jgi:hypothetical protein
MVMKKVITRRRSLNEAEVSEREKYYCINLLQKKKESKSGCLPGMGKSSRI